MNTERKSNCSQYAISRSINGISLNGQEFLLTPKGDVMTFANETIARSFAGKIATGRHDTDVDLEVFGINICQIDNDGNYTLL